MAKKRKHAEEASTEPSAAGKERPTTSGQKGNKDAPPKVVSSNWMQLQAVGVPGPSCTFNDGIHAATVDLSQ